MTKKALNEFILGFCLGSTCGQYVYNGHIIDLTLLATYGLFLFGKWMIFTKIPKSER